MTPGKRGLAVRPARAAPYEALAALALAFLVVTAAHAEDLPIVAAIKATYLTKFTPFVEWPGGSSGRPTLCILDDDRIAGLVDAAESRKPADEPPITVRRLAAGMPPTGCQMLLIGNAGPASAATALAEVSGAPVLTITSDAADGARGIVNFVIRADRVRFEIDDSEAARHGLKISSKLLSLAVSVTPRE